jgi:4-amino-4-deoxychorismate lyase
MLLESLKIENGVILNLEYHNARMHRSRQDILGLDIFQDVKDLPEIQKIPRSKKTIKVRILYNEDIFKVEWEFYTRREINSLKLIVDNEINYSYKFADRSRLSELFNKRDIYDDIVIVKDGMLTDSSYSNLAFFDGTRWCTPSTPLLNGTKRQQLIDENKLFESDIRVRDINLFQKCSLINALNEPGDIEINCLSIR